MERTTITTSTVHGYAAGDILWVKRESRWRALRRLLARPRVQFVETATASTMTIGERRMTWAEWRSAIWLALRG